jgi:hypothetical protein
MRSRIRLSPLALLVVLDLAGCVTGSRQQARQLMTESRTACVYLGLPRGASVWLGNADSAGQHDLVANLSQAAGTVVAQELEGRLNKAVPRAEAYQRFLDPLKEFLATQHHLQLVERGCDLHLRVMVQKYGITSSSTSSPVTAEVVTQIHVTDTRTNKVAYSEHRSFSQLLTSIWTFGGGIATGLGSGLNFMLLLRIKPDELRQLMLSLLDAGAADAVMAIDPSYSRPSGPPPPSEPLPALPPEG